MEKNWFMRPAVRLGKCPGVKMKSHYPFRREGSRKDGHHHQQGGGGTSILTEMLERVGRMSKRGQNAQSHGRKGNCKGVKVQNFLNRPPARKIKGKGKREAASRTGK